MSQQNKPGAAMSYAEAVKHVEELLFANKYTLNPDWHEALQICKNAAIECAARAAKKRHHAK